MSKKVSDILPKTEILAQLAEEASELAPKSVAECEANLTEEIANSKYFRWLSRLGTKEQSDE